MLRTIALLITLMAVPALAQESTLCVKRSDFIRHLDKTYHETPVAMGVTSSGRMLEVTASEDGSWTIIVTMPNGVTCGVASGENWETVKPAAVGDSGDGPAA